MKTTFYEKKIFSWRNIELLIDLLEFLENLLEFFFLALSFLHVQKKSSNSQPFLFDILKITYRKNRGACFFSERKWAYNRGGGNKILLKKHF